MKRAAFLSFDWNYVIMSEYYEGMKAYLDEHAGTQLVIFNAFGSYASYQYEEGACEIFSLCDPEDYDGFIIQGNRAWPPEMRQRVADEILALHKPVVSINYELKGTHYVGTDNYQAMYGLVHKVLVEKSCKRPAFVNGLATSVEARARAKAYRDACAMCFIEEPRRRPLRCCRTGTTFPTWSSAQTMTLPWACRRRCRNTACACLRT